MHARHPGSVATGVRPHAQSGGWGDVGPGWPSLSEPVSPRLGGSIQVNSPTSLSNPGRRSARTISISPPAPTSLARLKQLEVIDDDNAALAPRSDLYGHIPDALFRLMSWSRKHSSEQATPWRRICQLFGPSCPANYCFHWTLKSGASTSLRAVRLSPSKSHPSIFGSSRVASWATE
jgi:hypothetical protein